MRVTEGFLKKKKKQKKKKKKKRQQKKKNKLGYWLLSNQFIERPINSFIEPLINNIICFLVFVSFKHC